MDARSTTLTALAASPGQALTRVQAQKLLFLMDKQLADRLGGRAFDFAPYRYGPYDKKVYWALEGLIAEGLVAADTPGAGQSFRLTPIGQTVAPKVLAALPPDVATHIRRLADWVRSLAFADLVSAIYRAYPEMRASSIFRG